MLQLNQQEKEVFDSFSKSESGRVLKEYLEKVVSHVCDVRNIDEITPEKAHGAKIAAESIQEHIIGKIKNLTGERKVSDYQ